MLQPIRSRGFSTTFPRYISEETHELIREMFRKLIEGEIMIESSRKNLQLSPYFSTYENFELIKGDFMSYISREAVITYFILARQFFKR